MIAENCSTCKWSTVVGFHKETKTDVAECRRFPPTAQLAPDQNGQANKITFFPMVNAHMVCGEWYVAIITN